VTSAAEKPCAACAASGDPSTFYHSGDGLVCEACHRAAKLAEKSRDVKREGRFVIRCLGLLSVAGALLASAFVAYHPAGIVTGGALKLFACAVALPCACGFRLYTYPREAPGRQLWLRVAVACVAVAALAAGLFAWTIA
jgi:hypothetical protein